MAVYTLHPNFERLVVPGFGMLRRGERLRGDYDLLVGRGLLIEVVEEEPVVAAPVPVEPAKVLTEVVPPKPVEAVLIDKANDSQPVTVSEPLTVVDLPPPPARSPEIKGKVKGKR